MDCDKIEQLLLSPKKTEGIASLQGQPSAEDILQHLKQSESHPKPATNLEAIQAHLQDLSNAYSELQTELQEHALSRQKLEVQKQENLGIQKEFSKLKDGEDVYKLMGPVLLKQEKSEAKSAVGGRLEFIGKEISRLEDKFKETQARMNEKKAEMIKVQTNEQAAVQAADEVSPPA